jgi:hypothetical protein
MKFNKQIFDNLVKLIGSEQGVYSAIRRKETKHKAATSEILFYLVATEHDIKISKYIKDQAILDKVDLLIQKEENGSSKLENRAKVVTKIVKEEDPYNFPLSKFRIDSELIKDCKLIKPYRSCIKEALLTLETRIKHKLKVNKNGKALIQECKSRNVFKKNEPSEEEGLYFLFMGAIEWLRNPPSHNKIHYTKEDAVKIILFTDYLIGLFNSLCAENKII